MNDGGNIMSQSQLDPQKHKVFSIIDTSLFFAMLAKAKETKLFHDEESGRVDIGKMIEFLIKGFVSN